MSTSKNTTLSIAKASIVAALYIIITVLLGPLGSGAIQFRLSELFNFLAFYNRRYIASVVIGCAISNYIVSGPVDMIVGSLQTLVFVSLGVLLFGKMQDKLPKIQLEKRFLFFNILFSISMFVIAIELCVLFQAPFFFTWLTCGVGEFISLFVGGYIVQEIAKRVDLTK